MNRQAMFLRSLAVALGTGLAVAVPVFLLHDWFHGSLLPALAIPPNWGDALGTFAIALALFVAQHLVSVAVYRDWEFGRANAEKDAAEVHYATGGLDRQVFVSRYLVALPTEDQLRAWLAEERDVLARAQGPGPGAGEIQQTASGESDPEDGDGR